MNWRLTWRDDEGSGGVAFELSGSLVRMEVEIISRATGVKNDFMTKKHLEWQRPE